MMNNPYDAGDWQYYRSLERKMQLLAEGEEMELTPEEAATYGVDYADEFPEEDYFLEEEQDED
ncbi:hypothetical protein [Pedobacter sp. GR22-6]|uniref:hypothetical protein n=1 Tax=Pedobacter sp. GR22-6 TaxID=3127957 RepID=UPI00307E896C